MPDKKLANCRHCGIAPTPRRIISLKAHDGQREVCSATYTCARCGQRTTSQPTVVAAMAEWNAANSGRDKADQRNEERIYDAINLECKHLRKDKELLQEENARLRDLLLACRREKDSENGLAIGRALNDRGDEGT